MRLHQETTIDPCSRAARTGRHSGRDSPADSADVASLPTGFLGNSLTNLVERVARTGGMMLPPGGASQMNEESLPITMRTLSAELEAALDIQHAEERRLRVRAVTSQMESLAPSSTDEAG